MALGSILIAIVLPFLGFFPFFGYFFVASQAAMTGAAAYVVAVG